MSNGALHLYQGRQVQLGCWGLRSPSIINMDRAMSFVLDIIFTDPLQTLLYKGLGPRC